MWPKGFLILSIHGVSLCIWTYTNTNALKNQTSFSPFRGRGLQTDAVNGRKTMKCFLSSNKEVLPGSRVMLDGSWEGRDGRRRWANLWFHQKNVHVKCVGGWGRIWNHTSVIPHAPVLHVWLWGFASSGKAETMDLGANLSQICSIMWLNELFNLSIPHVWSRRLEFYGWKRLDTTCFGDLKTHFSLTADCASSRCALTVLNEIRL